MESFRWRCHVLRSNGVIVKRYAVAGNSQNGTRVFIHRLVCPATDGKTADHINGDGLDNRRVNLRLATRAEQTRNRAPHSHRGGKPRPTPYKGVSLPVSHVPKPWLAQIWAEGRAVRLGRFDTDVEAALAYNAAAVKYFGEFARLNEVSTDRAVAVA